MTATTRHSAAMFAEPHTLLGRLQRGRGDAVRELLSLPRAAAAPTVLQCLCTAGVDPQHGTAYTELVTACVPDLTPWYRWFRELTPELPEEEVLCAFHVLGALARLDHGDTRAFLRAYVLDGRRWHDALSQYLMDALELDEEAWMQLLPRLDDETLRLHCRDNPVWMQLATINPRVARLLETRRQQQQRLKDELAWTEHNYANAALSQQRWRVLMALLQCDPAAAQPLLVDGLWDGSWRYRELCIERCDPNWPLVRARLQELASCPDEAVAKAARSRLEVVPPA